MRPRGNNTTGNKSAERKSGYAEETDCKETTENSAQEMIMDVEITIHKTLS